MFHWEHSRLFNKHAFERAHAFYEEYGGITLVAARFLPFLRTFAPFVAGVAQMTRAKFTIYDVTGGTLWVVSIVTAGYLFGNLGVGAGAHEHHHLDDDRACPACWRCSEPGVPGAPRRHLPRARPEALRDARARAAAPAADS